MAGILHQLIGSLSHDLQGFIHVRWLAGFQPSTVVDDEASNIQMALWRRRFFHATNLLPIELAAELCLPDANAQPVIDGAGIAFVPRQPTKVHPFFLMLETGSVLKTVNHGGFMYALIIVCFNHSEMRPKIWVECLPPWVNFYNPEVVGLMDKNPDQLIYTRWGPYQL